MGEVPLANPIVPGALSTIYPPKGTAMFELFATNGVIAPLGATTMPDWSDLSKSVPGVPLGNAIGTPAPNEAELPKTPAVGRLSNSPVLARSVVPAAPATVYTVFCGIET